MCSELARSGLAQNFHEVFDKVSFLWYHARARSLLDYIETVVTPPKIVPYCVTLSAFCIII